MKRRDFLEFVTAAAVCPVLPKADAQRDCYRNLSSDYVYGSNPKTRWILGGNRVGKSETEDYSELMNYLGFDRDEILEAMEQVGTTKSGAFYRPAKD